MKQNLSAIPKYLLQSSLRKLRTNFKDKIFETYFKYSARIEFSEFQQKDISSVALYFLMKLKYLYNANQKLDFCDSKILYFYRNQISRILQINSFLLTFVETNFQNSRNLQNSISMKIDSLKINSLSKKSQFIFLVKLLAQLFL